MTALRALLVAVCMASPVSGVAQVPSFSGSQTTSPAAGDQHQHPPNPAPPPPAGAQGDDHAQHRPAEALPASIPPISEADRIAAFPKVHGHATHGSTINYFVLFDQFEGQAASGLGGFSWDTKGWVGKDRDRLWFRTEGDRVGGRLEQAQTNVLYGRAITRWWDVTAGVRFDTLPATPRTAVAVGVQGLAPYWFEVEASTYIELSGRTHVRLETAYDLLVTNRLVLQPLVEFEVYGRADPERRIDAGLSTGELGLRLRYEIRRELAPYVGVVWNRKFFGTADNARAAGDRTSGTRVAAGVRFWM